MSLDDARMDELLEESNDLQADAMRTLKAHEADIADYGRQQRDQPIDLDRIRRYNHGRREFLRNGGLGVGALAASGLLGTAFGTSVMSIVAQPAAAQMNVAVQIFQTASSLENLAVATYGAALQLPFVAGNATIKAFAETTQKQHAEHGAAFKAQTRALGGQAQEGPNPKYAPVVQEEAPGLTDALKVVNLAATLEEVAADTYLANLALLEDTEPRVLMASVLGVETQHLATLRAVKALLENNLGRLVKIPTDVADLPAVAGSVAFPEPFEVATLASPPAEGAL